MTHWDKAIEAIKNSSKDARIYVGCDSIRYKKNGMWEARYDSVVVLHHPRDGCNIFSYSVKQPDYGNIKTRMLMEVNFVTAAAMEIIDYIDGRYLEIHLDMNADPRYKSNVAVQEAIGWVRAQTGITPKIKPEAWASSHVADHWVRGKFNKQGILN